MKHVLLSAVALASVMVAAPAMAQGADAPIYSEGGEYPGDNTPDSYPSYEPTSPEAEYPADQGGYPADDYTADADVPDSYGAGTYEPPVVAGQPGYRRVQPGDYVDPSVYQGNEIAPPPRRCRGTTGAILGGIAGALLGAGDGDRRGRYGRYGRYRRGSSTAGALIGGGIGAVIGSEIDKSACRDRRR